MITTVPMANTAAQMVLRNLPLRVRGSVFFMIRWCRGLKSIYKRVDQRRTVKKGAKSLHTRINRAIRIIPKT
jgi:endo-1,4-beta-mannosidase